MATKGYAIGQEPPELHADGSFRTAIDTRAFSIIDDNGRVLVVDKDSNLLVEQAGDIAVLSDDVD